MTDDDAAVVAVIVVCPAEVREAAEGWGRAGLIADSFWVSSDEAAHIDLDNPNRVTARRIRPGVVHDPAPLALALHELGALDEVRVAWIRPPVDTLSQSLKSLERLLRELIPPDQNNWLDIVVPTRRTDRTVAPLPGQWVQLRVLPEDRSAPDVTDAGWDLDLDVALHAALVVIGILGGTFRKVPWAMRSADHHHELRVFSRVVLGAANTEPEARRFVAQTMPLASAATFFSSSYLELDDEESRALVHNAVTHMLSLDSAALSYADPAPSHLIEPPRLSVWQHLVVLFRFLGHCLAVLVGVRRAPKVDIGSKFDFTDLGYNVRDTPTPTEVDATPRMLDFDALDAALAAEARRVLEQLDRDLQQETPTSPARAWRTLVRLATSLNDGGSRPDGWDPPENHHRQPVLAAPWVQPTAREPVSTQIPELSVARNPAVAVLAVNDARRVRNVSLVAPDDTGDVVATAHELVDSGNAQDRDRLAEQIDELESPVGPEPVSFLDRLSGRLIGAGLRARLDAERWSEFATAPTQPDRPTLLAAERRFRKRTFIGLGATAGGGVAWGLVAKFFHAALPAWLSMPVGFGLIGTVAAVYLLWTCYSYFKAYSSYLERGRRRIELRRIWLERACIALREAFRLREPRRIHTKWLDLLSAIFPYDDTSISRPARPMPARPPKGAAVAVPVYTDAEMTAWLAEEGAVPGWRQAAFHAMAAAALEKPEEDAVKLLVEDSGLKGGPLHDMWQRRNALWERHAAALRSQLAGDIAGRMVDSPDRAVSVLMPDTGNRPGSTIGTFSEEPWPGEHRDESAELWPLDYPVRGSRHGRRINDLHHNPDTCAISVRIQLRTLVGDDRPDDGDGPTGDDADGAVCG